MCAILAGFLIYILSTAIGNYFVDRYYMSPEAVSSRRLDVYNELKTYVQDHQLSSRDSVRLGEWTMQQEYVTIVVRSEHTRVEAGNWGAATTELPRGGEKTFPELSGEGIYYLRFADGIFQISISESSHTREYALVTIISLILACVAVLTLMAIYIHQITHRVVQLSNVAQDIGRGNLQREIYVSGHDELSLLGREMDDMRQGILRRIASEHKAWQANSSLITAISHDLRTPMTAMIGYLELLKSGSHDEAQRQRFLDSAHNKAMELKDLTDELFKYFLVFGNADIPLKCESYDAGILLDQLLGENVIELSDAGYKIRYLRLQGECRIYVDVLHLKRLFDNLLSNIRKYADQTRPVVILSEIVDERTLSICFSNSKGEQVGKVESSGIGLETCYKIAEQLGGRFKCGGDDDHFVAELFLPLEQDMHI